MFVVNGLTNKIECVHFATADGVSVCAATVITGETSVCSAQCGIIASRVSDGYLSSHLSDSLANTMQNVKHYILFVKTQTSDPLCTVPTIFV